MSKETAALTVLRNTFGLLGSTAAKEGGEVVTKTYGRQLFDGTCKVVKAIKNGLTSSTLNMTGYLLHRDPGDAFYAAGGWGAYIAGLVIKAPLAITNVACTLEDLRRVREIASGQSNFYTSRDAAFRTLELSSAATLASGVSLFGLGNLAASQWMKGAGPNLKPLRALSGLFAAGLCGARYMHKWTTIDSVYNPNLGTNLMPYAKPILRVDDPTSPYYNMSQALELSANSRMAQDLKYGQAGDNSFNRSMEQWLMGANTRLLG